MGCYQSQLDKTGLETALFHRAADRLDRSEVRWEERFGRVAKILAEVGHNPQVIARGDRGVVATLEFLMKPPIQDSDEEQR
jgi:hypothetical protein